MNIGFEIVHDVIDDPAEPARQLSAMARTSLLHRLMILRHLGAFGGSLRSPGAEAVAAAVDAVVSPADSIVVRRERVTVPVCDAPATVSLARYGRSGRPARVCALFSSGCSIHVPVAVTVDGQDAEAVLAAASAAGWAARTSRSACLLIMLSGSVTGRRDPITILVDRMRLAHQLDDNALEAIDADAHRVATRMMRGDRPAPRWAVLADELARLFPPRSIPNGQR